MHPWKGGEVMEVVLFSFMWFGIGVYAGIYIAERRGKEGGNDGKA